MILSKIIHTSSALGPRKIVTSQLQNALNSKVILRHGGGGGRRILRPRNFLRSGLLPLFIRYFAIGLVPSALIAGYCNMFVGDAVLYDHDPEVFQPDYWEYYKHPISRFLAKYCMEDPSISYYKDIYILETAMRDHKQVTLVAKVKQLQELEQEGMIPLQRHSPMSRALSDDLEEYVDKNLRNP